MRSRRTLRRGASGERVRQLQERLRWYGYEVGEADGHFGYVTEDALIRFQRDLRLRADGIVGPRTVYALEEAPPQYRVAHVVRKGERLGDIARLYDVPLSALRWMNGFKPNARLRPGRRLVIWRPDVLVSPHSGANPQVIERNTRPYGRSISGLAAPAFHCDGDGSIASSLVDDYRALSRERDWDFFVSIKGKGRSLAAIMMRRRSQSRFLDDVRHLDSQGMAHKYLFEFGSIPLGGGTQVAALAEQLKRDLPQAVTIVSIPPLHRGWRALVRGFDAAKAARSLDRIVLDLHWEQLLDSRSKPVNFVTVERWLAEALRELPPWKVWLGVPVDGWRIGVNTADDDDPVTYRQVMSQSLREGTKPHTDDLGYLHLEPAEGARYILQGRDSWARFLQIALRYKISGIYVHAIGGEDRRLWDLFSHRIRATSSFRGVGPPSS